MKPFTYKPHGFRPVRAGPGPPARGDWWMRGIGPLAALHAAVFVTLHMRPGRIAVHLWNWGPPVLAAAAIVLLAGALLSGLYGRQTWTWRRAIALAALAGLVGSLTLYRTFPSEHDRSPSAVAMRVPLDGPVTVAWGGPTPRVNYHVRSPAERWAFDLLVTREGRSQAGNGERPTDYYAYDLPVRAPAKGRVVAVRDGVPDALPGRPEPSRGAGNLLVVEVAPGQYLVLMHLKAGSLRVGPDQAVDHGDIVARVGNSGNSTEPHLHVHLQDSPVPGRGQGIPFHFAEYVDLASGAVIERGMPTGGMRRGRYVGDMIRAMEADDAPP